MLRLREALSSDLKGIVEVYNSNRLFLINHLSVESVDIDFIRRENEEMVSMGFISAVILDSHNSIIGVLDYKLDEPVYLSLLMIKRDYRGRGFGSGIYKKFENLVKEIGACSIRIDVVRDYPETSITFWKRMGYIQGEEVNLTWGDKNFTAVKMEKII